jgi:hypothetical protein
MMSVWGTAAALAAMAQQAIESSSTPTAGDDKEEDDVDEEDEGEEEVDRDNAEDLEEKEDSSQPHDSEVNANNNKKKKKKESKKAALAEKKAFELAEKKKRAAAAMPIPYASVVGALQRMVVSSPERAPVRASLLASILQVLSCLHVQASTTTEQTADIVINNDDVIAVSDSSSPEVALASNDVLARQAIVHFLQFLGKLSKSNKISHRAYSLDIATAVLAEEWVWNLEVSKASKPSSGSSPSSPSTMPMDVSTSSPGEVSPAEHRRLSRRQSTLSTTSADTRTPGLDTTSTSSSEGSGFGERGPKSLLAMVLGRCDDSAPTVRIRAIGAFCGKFTLL